MHRFRPCGPACAARVHTGDGEGQAQWDSSMAPTCPLPPRGSSIAQAKVSAIVCVSQADRALLERARCCQPADRRAIDGKAARHVSELIDAVGPFDTTSIKGDSRAYNWFRFGNCRLTALTSLEGKIQKLELEGTGTGCEVYQQKLGA